MNVLSNLKSFTEKHGSTMCTVCVFIGLGFTIYETWQARPKVDKIMGDYHEAVKVIKEDKTKTEEEVKKAVNGEKVEAAKKIVVTVIPMAAGAFATGGSAVAARVIDAKTIHEMAATIEIGDVAYRKLEQKMIDVLGEEKTKEAKEEINEEKAKEAIERVVVEGGELSVIEQGKGGSQVYYDPQFNFLFKSDDNTIREVCHQMNERMGCKPFDEPYMTYEEFFDNMRLSIPGAAKYFRFTPDKLMKPILCNAIKHGDISCTVLDWRDEPECRVK